MARYAIIVGSSVVNVVDYGSDPGNPPPGFDSPAIAVQTDVASPGWTYSNGVFSGPTPPQPPVIPLPVQADSYLTKSDITVLRCISAGIPVPTEWQTYRTALRAIVNGTDTASTSLPTQPPYPAGT